MESTDDNEASHLPGCERKWNDEAACRLPDMCGKPIQTRIDLERLVCLLYDGSQGRCGISTPECHVLEDHIHQETLRYFAAHATTAAQREMAELALSTLTMRFSRWYE